MDSNENIVENKASHTQKARKRQLDSGQPFDHTGPYTMDDWMAGNEASESGGQRGVRNVKGPVAGPRPKRNVTAFSLFVKEREMKLTGAQKKKMAGGIGGHLLAEWKLLTPKDKAAYEAREAELKAPTETVPIPVQQVTVHPVRASSSSRNGLTAFSLFAKERESKLTNVQKKKMAGGIGGHLLAEWKSMTPKEKAPFEAREAEFKALTEPVSIPVRKTGVRHVRGSSSSQNGSRASTMVEPALSPDLAAITPTLIIEDGFPWNLLFESLNIEPFSF